jgi:hypothetical protein
MAQNPPQPRKRRPRGLTRHRRRETARLLRSALDAGLTVRGLEVDPVSGALRVLISKPDEPSNDLDNWLKK